VIAHVVLFTPRRNLPPAERSELARSFERALRDIPSLRRAHVGRRSLHGAGYEAAAPDYSHAAILEFDDHAGLQAYLQHSAHSEPAQRFFAAAEATQILDYEMVEGSGVADAAVGWL
jgi:hypothetical protein